MNNPTFLRRVQSLGLPLAVVVTVVLTIGYVKDQQSLRMLANEPRERLMHETAGHSLRLMGMEEQETGLRKRALTLWLMAMLGIFLVSAVTVWLQREKVTKKVP